MQMNQNRVASATPIDIKATRQQQQEALMAVNGDQLLRNNMIMASSTKSTPFNFPRNPSSGNGPSNLLDLFHVVAAASPSPYSFFNQATATAIMGLQGNNSSTTNNSFTMAHERSHSDESHTGSFSSHEGESLLEEQMADLNHDEKTAAPRHSDGADDFLLDELSPCEAISDENESATPQAEDLQESSIFDILDHAIQPNTTCAAVEQAHLNSGNKQVVMNPASNPSSSTGMATPHQLNNLLNDNFALQLQYQLMQYRFAQLQLQQQNNQLQQQANFAASLENLNKVPSNTWQQSIQQAQTSEIAAKNEAVDAILAQQKPVPKNPSPSKGSATPQQSFSVQHQPQQPQLTMVVEPETYRFQANSQQVKVLVRGARDNKFDDLRTLTEINSLPYKYHFKVITPAALFADQKKVAAAPAATQKKPGKGSGAADATAVKPFQNDLFMRMVCMDAEKGYKLVEIEDGLVIDKFVKMREYAEHREYEFKLHLLVYSHAFNKSSFFIQIFLGSTGNMIYESNKFFIYARRKKRNSIDNGPQESSNMEECTIVEGRIQSSSITASPSSSTAGAHLDPASPPAAKKLKNRTVF